MARLVRPVNQGLRAELSREWDRVGRIDANPTKIATVLSVDKRAERTLTNIFWGAGGWKPERWHLHLTSERMR